MIGQIQVIEPGDALHRRVWNFNFCEPLIRLARYDEQERTSKRHKWRTVRIWSKYKGERICGEWLAAEPKPSQAVREQALAILFASIRFERWPTPKRTAQRTT